jgi:hypothetical protein
MKPSIRQVIMAPIVALSLVAGIFFGIYGDEVRMMFNVYM